MTGGCATIFQLHIIKDQELLKKYLEPDVAFVKVAPMDAKGFFNLGTSNSVTPSYLSKAKKIVVEVNESVPNCLGGNSENIHISQVDYVVEGNNEPLFQLPKNSTK